VATVAYYTAPYEAVTRLLIVPAGLSGALFPALSASGAAADGAARDERLLGRPLRFLLLGLAPLVIVLIGCAGLLIRAWLGPTYAARSTTAFAILAVGVLINGLAHLPYAYLLGRGRPDLPAKFHLLELPLYVVGGWLLIRQWGVNGAALAWTLRVTADAALLAAAVWRVAGMPPTRLLGNRGGRAAAAVAALVAAAASGAALAPDAATRAVVVGVLAAVFVVGVWRFVLNDVERTGLRRVLA
jgi:O-antigen/teichoic acid export membrane protein